MGLASLGFFAMLALLVVLADANPDAHLVIWVVGALLLNVVLQALLARLLNARRRSEKLAARLKAIGGLARLLSVSPGLEGLSQQLLHSLRELTQCYNANLFQRQGEELVMVAGDGGYAGDAPVGLRLTVGEGIIGQAVAQKRTLLVNDVAASPHYRAWEGLPLTRAELAMPVWQGERIIAVLDLESAQHNGFDPDDLEPLRVLTDQLAVALDNLRLLEEARARAADMEELLRVSMRHLEQVAALHTLDEAITATLDLRVVLQMVLEQAMARLNVDAASILLYRPEDQTLEYGAKRGFHTGALEFTRLHLGEGHAGRAALEQRVVAVLDLPGAMQELTRSPMLAREGFQVYLAVPLIAKEKIQGVLEVFQREAFQPNEEWIQFLESLGRLAAIAIENASLMEGMERVNAELTATIDATLQGWAMALEMRDYETRGHSQRVTDLTMRLGRALGVDNQTLIQLNRGALLHDIGKLAIPDMILKKPGPLDEHEWAVMRQHPELAYHMLSAIPFLQPVLDIPYGHHERWDGQGYPRGLRGEEIPLAARIFAVVDVWDAVTNRRVYHEAWPLPKAVDHLRAGAGTQFDPAIVEVFLREVA